MDTGVIMRVVVMLMLMVLVMIMVAMKVTMSAIEMSCDNPGSLSSRKKILRHDKDKGTSRLGAFKIQVTPAQDFMPRYMVYHQ